MSYTRNPSMISGEGRGKKTETLGPILLCYGAMGSVSSSVKWGNCVIGRKNNESVLKPCLDGESTLFIAAMTGYKCYVKQKPPERNQV